MDGVGGTRPGIRTGSDATRRRHPHRVGKVNGMEKGLDTEDRRVEVWRGRILQELRREIVSGEGIERRVQPARRVGGTEQELPESFLGKSFCREEQALGTAGKAFAATSPIQFEWRRGSRRRTVSGFRPGTWRAVCLQGLVATPGFTAFRAQPLRTEPHQAFRLARRKQEEQQIGNRPFHARLPQGYPSSLTLHLQTRATRSESTINGAGAARGIMGSLARIAEPER